MAQTLSAASVSLKVETVEGQGASVETPISAGRCEGLGALQFDLSYDPAIVEPETVEAGRLLPSGLVEFDVPKPGALCIALVSSDPVNEPGELLKVRFKQVASEGGRTELSITRETAWDHEKGLEMLVTTEAGSLTLRPGVAASRPFAENGMVIALVIGGAVVLLLILAAIIALARRGKATPTQATAPASAGSSAQAGFCAKCGAPRGAGARFCTSCGQTIGP